MKKILILLLGLVMAMSLKAQSDGGGFVRKGRVLVETGTAFGFIATEHANGASLGLNGGYFVSENDVVKLGLALRSLSLNNTSVINSKSFGWSLGYKRYMLRDRFFGGVDLSGTLDEGNVFVLRPYVGYPLRLADNIRLEASVGYSLPFASLGGWFDAQIGFALFL